MYHLFLLCMMFISLFGSTDILKNNASVSKALVTNITFSNPRCADYYWQALLDAAHDNKQEALNIAAGIKADSLPDTLPAWKNEQSIDGLFDYLFLQFVASRPQSLSQFGLFESINIRDHNGFLNDASCHMQAQEFLDKQQGLEALKAFDQDSLTDDQKLSYKIFYWIYNHDVEGAPFLFHDYKMNQMDSILSDLSLLFTQIHQLTDEQDAQLYCKRLGKIPEQIEQAIHFVEYQKEHGVIPPRFTVERMISLIQKSAPEPITHHAFYKHLEQKLAALNVPNKQEFLTKAANTLKNDVYPAYKKLQQLFVQLQAVATNNNGVWALPNGEAYYAHKLKFHTTTNLPADEIYNLGLQEVATVQAEMREIFAQEGIVDETRSVGQLMHELSKDPRFYYANTDAGRAACLADYESILERSRKELGHLFDLKPLSGVIIQRVPEVEQEGAPAAYYCVPSMDGSRPGIFFANLRNMDEVPTYGMETLAIHEAEPGHHFQIALQQQMSLPIVRKIFAGFNAYVEGWALYVEKLAYEENFYSSSYSKLGHLQDELMRAARLVVDTGIHHKRWTREQAIEYMKDVVGLHHDSAVTEVERYFVLPGQACSYKIGQLKILELRQKAKDALGDAFDIREFHNIVLKVAAVPLAILEEVVNSYIEDKLTVETPVMAVDGVEL